MRMAFKEWAVVVDALAQGEQIVILRKGGIHEAGGGFQVEHERFLLFPTRYHQQAKSVLPEAQARSTEIINSLPDENTLRLGHFAEIAEWRELVSLDAARRLKGQHVWRDEVIAQRFERGRSKGVFALAVRVFCLAEPAELPMLEEYGGCKSWFEVARDISVEGATPVLSDDAFQAKLAAFSLALNSAPA